MYTYICMHVYKVRTEEKYTPRRVSSGRDVLT